jgi:hypothetical protein
MEAVIEQVGEAVVGGVLQETVDELTGRSGRKWAVMLLAFLIGGVVVAIVIKSRARLGSEDAVEPATDGTAPTPN